MATNEENQNPTNEIEKMAEEMIKKMAKEMQKLWPFEPWADCIAMAESELSRIAQRMQNQ